MHAPPATTQLLRASISLYATAQITFSIDIHECVFCLCSRASPRTVTDFAQFALPQAANLRWRRDCRRPHRLAARLPRDRAAHPHVVRLARRSRVDLARRPLPPQLFAALATVDGRLGVSLCASLRSFASGWLACGRRRARGTHACGPPSCPPRNDGTHASPEPYHRGCLHHRWTVYLAFLAVYAFGRSSASPLAPRPSPSGRVDDSPTSFRPAPLQLPATLRRRARTTRRRP